MHAAAAARWDRARLGRDDVEQLGYVMNASRLWGRLPDEHDALFRCWATPRGPRG